jgi:serine/threonine protein kinase
VDAWACGVILYTLLIGRPPFWHRKQMMLIRQIMRGDYTMDGPDWSEVTSETKDLVIFIVKRRQCKMTTYVCCGLTLPLSFSLRH